MANSSTSTAVWTEKYRPTRLADIKGHRRIKQLFERAIQKHFIGFPPTILYGPPGTGKTSIALALAQEAYPDISPTISTLYLNASDERSIEVIRDRILQFTQTHWPGVTRKFVIFDEVETMTEPAQLTLRALMDAPLVPGTPLPLFLFLCNTLSRIVPLVRSRALALFCGHLTSNQIHGLLSKVQEKEGVKTPLPTPLACLLNRGDMRSFMQRAQQGENPNSWLPWFQRLLNTPPERVHIVWEEGSQRVPLWILIRHVLVFCYSMGLTVAVGPDRWTEWLTSVLQNRIPSFDHIVKAWIPIATALQTPKVTPGITAPI